MGGRGDPIKLTLLIGGLDNLTRNLNTKFKIANLKSFWLMASIRKNNLTPLLGGEGGSDQTDTILSGGGDSPKEAIV